MGANEVQFCHRRTNTYLTDLLALMDEEEAALQLPEDDDEDEEVDVNGDYEAESDDEPV